MCMTGLSVAKSLTSGLISSSGAVLASHTLRVLVGDRSLQRGTPEKNLLIICSNRPIQFMI